MRHRYSWSVIQVWLATMLWVPIPAGAAGQEQSQRPPVRIASLNVCTDQLLLALADSHQIAGLSRFSRDPEYSYFADRAIRHRRLRGTVEEILRLKPDLVLTSSYTSPDMRRALKRFAIPTESFEPATTVAQGRRDIAQLAARLGQSARGGKLIAAIDEALASSTIRSAVWRGTSSAPLTALALQRRAFISGNDTVAGDLLQALGVRNTAELMGIRSIGRASLETLVRKPPGILIVEKNSIVHADQGEAILSHPALVRAIPESRRVVLEQRFIVCAGPSLPDAINRLTDGIESAIRSRPAP